MTIGPVATMEEAAIVLRKLWAVVLGIPEDRIGPEENFFDLGGNSILAIKLRKLLRKNGIDMLVGTIFAHPVFSDMILAIDFNNQAKETALPVGTIYKDTELRKELSSGQWFSAEEISSISPATEPQRSCTEAPLEYYLISIPPSIDHERLERAWQNVVQRHASLRTIFVWHASGDLFQVVLRTLKFAMKRVNAPDDCSDIHEYARKLCEADATQIRPIEYPQHHTIMVSRGTSNVLIVALSHTVYDGGSLEPLMSSFMSAYEAKTAKLPSVTTDFPDYIKYRLSQRGPSLWGFWQKYLEFAQMTFLTQPPAGCQEIVSASRQTEIPTCPTGITLTCVVQAAWSIALARQTNLTDIVFGYTTSGRDVPLLDMDNVVGCCISTVPIRVRMQPTWAGTTLLEHVRAQMVKTMQHIPMDFDDIVAHATPWLVQSEFGSSVTHQEENYSAQLVLEGALCQSTTHYLGVYKRLHVVTGTLHGKLHLSILPCKGVIMQKDAESLVDSLVDAVMRLTACPDDLIGSWALARTV